MLVFVILYQCTIFKEIISKYMKLFIINLITSQVNLKYSVNIKADITFNVQQLIGGLEF